ncbi:MAG TPA: hypothetical protein DCE42_02970 [Myxococcales bacterium]|nr:hypothetical protein [Deltaproteobacteria bacterium]MBU54257.1 hypothetical protein [Deltaproteobacteria bacterium]HAA53687.1 hypothetical protein [Myxococcales bacterium]|tara:strand:+ start:23294 stop:24076 length:783 start_codon:yes stop_codon:yes gene_type:complete
MKKKLTLRHTYHSRWFWLGVVLLGLLSYSVEAKSPASLAASLARLRIEVEGLSSKLEDRKESMRTQLRTLSMQQSAAKLSVQKAQMELNMLSQRSEKQRTQIEQAGKSQEALRPIVLASITRFEQQMRAGLPFRIKGRLQAIQEIGKKLKGKLITPRDAAVRLWNFITGELRLARENGLYTQVIVLDGTSQLVEIVRLGMVMMYIKTRDHRFGRAVRVGEQWQYKLYTDKEQSKQVEALFDAMRKQIRVGFWTLPNALSR